MIRDSTELRKLKALIATSGLCKNKKGLALGSGADDQRLFSWLPELSCQV
jgi:hypothetical protein